MIRWLYVLSLLIHCTAVLAQVHNFSSAGTTDGTSSNANFKLVSVVGQPIASSSADFTQPRTGFLQTTNFIIVVEDKVPPVITFTPPATIAAGAPNTLNLLINDVNAITLAEIHYRPISGTSFQKASLTKGSGGNYSVSIPSSWPDAMGIEYFFTATDAAPTPNSSRKPETGTYFTRVTSSEVNFPLTSFGADQNNYRIVAFPYTKGDNAIINVLTDLGTYDNTKWRLQTYQNSGDKFIEYPGDFISFERGRAYWLIVRNTTTVGIDNLTAPQETQASLFEVTLHPGWNMVGNPYPVDIKWSTVQAWNNNDADIGPMNVHPGGWETADVIPRFQGGFVNYKGTTAKKISIPFPGQTAGGRIASNIFSSDIDSESWKVGLQIIQGSDFNKLGAFGMRADAKLELDRYDEYSPPSFTGAPSITFDVDDISTSIVTHNSNHTWSFTANAKVGEFTELRWNDDLGESDQLLTLLDTRTLTKINMKETSSYRYQQTTGKYPFMVFLGDKISVNEMLATAPYPNPVRNGDNLTFRIALPGTSSSYHVRFKLLSSNGVDVHEHVLEIMPGVHELSFPLATQSTGLYIYKLDVNSSMMLNGKIVVR